MPDDIICGPSAFNFYRTPPLVATHYEALPLSRDLGARLVLPKHPLIQDVLKTPLHTLTFDRASHTGAKDITRQLEREAELRQELFIDWLTLAQA